MILALHVELDSPLCTCPDCKADVSLDVVTRDLTVKCLSCGATFSRSTQDLPIEVNWAAQASPDRSP